MDTDPQEHWLITALWWCAIGAATLGFVLGLFS